MAIDTRQENLRLSWEQGDDLVLSLDPLQGHWTEEQYLLLSDQTNRLLEYTDGYIEVLPIPTDNHQAMLEWFFLALKAFIEQIGGKVRFAPLRVLVREGKYREPDILLVRDARDPRRQNRFWLGADLVVEVVSEDDPERDTKVTVLVLVGETYREHGIFRRGDQAVSKLLEGFVVSVDEVLDAE